MSLALTILGCGSSGGVPRVAQGWGACDPANPRNRRRRCSVLVERGAGGGKTSVLVDTSPDLRDQLLDAAVDRLDGVLITHSHADHTHGIDDLRPLVIAMRRKIDIHMDEATSSVVRRAFDYLFEARPGSLYPPLLNEARLAIGARRASTARAARSRRRRSGSTMATSARSASGSAASPIRLT